MLRSHLCDYSDEYIVVTEEITVVKRLFTVADFVAQNSTQAIVTATNTANTDNIVDRKLAFESSASFIPWVSKMNNVLIGNAEDWDVAMPKFNLIEHSKNHSEKAGSLWNSSRDETDSGVNNGINYSIRDWKSFDYKTKFIESVTNTNLIKQDVKIVVLLKILSNIWKTLINVGINLVLTWSENKRCELYKWSRGV